MPPKSCRGRDTTNLQEYINDPLKEKKSLFVKALFNDRFLQKFDGQIGVNECIFSYPDSDWYSVYLLDPQGNKMWNPATGEVQYYFKLKIAPSGREAITVDGTTDISFTDLVGKTNCAVNENGNCALPSKASKASKEPKAPRAKKATSADEAGPSEKVDASVVERLQMLSLNGKEPSKGSKETAPREYFEQMKNKMLIVQWMIDNMHTEDIVECIKRGSLSPEDIRRAESVSKTEPEPTEEKIAEIASMIPTKEVRKMLQKITKEDIVNNLIQQYPDPANRINGIIELCAKAGKKLEIRQTKRGPKIFDFNGEQVEASDALNECSGFEAERVHQRIMSRRRSVLRSVIPALKKGKMPAYTPSITSKPATADSIIVEINSISNPIERKNAIVDLCKQFGYTVKPSKRSVGGMAIYDPDDEQVSDEIALEECAGLKAATMASVSFGKKKVRKSPKASATLYPVGTKKVGINKKIWVVKKISNGVKRWVKK
jgi:hypothetical protein